MLDGRVKTLHPKIHGGILADRSKPEHLAEIEREGIEPIDLVVVNLYPFISEPSIEMIDIGGPTMVRAAAKNHAHVAVVTNPAEYPVVLGEVEKDGAVSDETRYRLARQAFAHTAAYDAAIVTWFDELAPGGEAVLPPTIHLALERAGELRYGENPHQDGARYRRIGGATGVLGRCRPARRQGALLSQPLRRRGRMAPRPRTRRRRRGRDRGRGHREARKSLRRSGRRGSARRLRGGIRGGPDLRVRGNRRALRTRRRHDRRSDDRSPARGCSHCPGDRR